MCSQSIFPLAMLKFAFDYLKNARGCIVSRDANKEAKKEVQKFRLCAAFHSQQFIPDDNNDITSLSWNPSISLR